MGPETGKAEFQSVLLACPPPWDRAAQKSCAGGTGAGGSLAGRGLGSSLTRTRSHLALPGGPAGGCAQRSCLEEQKLPDACQGASPAFRKTERCLLSHRIAEPFPFPSHCPLREDQEGQKRERVTVWVFQREIWGEDANSAATPIKNPI